MRIGFLLYDTLLGGTEWASVRLMLAMRPLGYTFEAISLTPAGPMKDVLEREGIPCTDLPRAGKGGWRNLPRLVRAIRAMRPDGVILASHNPVATLAAWLARVPVRVQIIHHHHIDVKHPLEWRGIYWLSSWVQQLILFVSNFIRTEALALLPRLGPRSEVIHNISPPARKVGEAERLRARATLGLPSDARIVGNAGRHVPVKRFDVFLDVAAKVADRDPKVSFLLAGAGPLTESLKARATALGIMDRIRWLPWLKSMDDFYAAIDVLLFNSDIDAMPLMPIEAMSFGVPVVASVLAGSVDELIETGEQGCLLRQHDVDRLAAQVLEFLGPRGAAVGAAGRERSQRYGAPLEIATRVAEVLQSASTAARRRQ